MSNGANIFITERMKKATVIGSGSIHHGITQLFAMNGFENTMWTSTMKCCRKPRKN
jgi:3-hydroxyacyl-CoA dehydrogenase